MAEHFKPIDVAFLLQEYVVLRYLNKATYDRMYHRAYDKKIWYNERIHEDICELADQVYEVAELNDVKCLSRNAKTQRSPYNTNTTSKRTSANISESNTRT